jgi:hypothetical protein
MLPPSDLRCDEVGDVFGRGGVSGEYRGYRLPDIAHIRSPAPPPFPKGGGCSR